MRSWDLGRRWNRSSGSSITGQDGKLEDESALSRCHVCITFNRHNRVTHGHWADDIWTRFDKTMCPRRDSGSYYCMRSLQHHAVLVASCTSSVPADADGRVDASRGAAENNRVARSRSFLLGDREKKPRPRCRQTFKSRPSSHRRKSPESQKSS